MPSMLLICMVVLGCTAPVLSRETTRGASWAHPFTAEDDAAVSWLQTHSRGKDGPDMSDLAELQAENPEAYAIVKALLVKNSLGLIRRKTAEMSEASTQAFAAAGEEKAKAAEMERGFFGWKPTDDSGVVQSVLGESQQEVPEDRQVQHEWVAEEKDGFAAPHVDFNDKPLPVASDKLDQNSRAEEQVNDIFSKGLTRARTAHDITNGGKGSVFWSGLMKGQPFNRPTSSSLSLTKEDSTAISSSHYLKDFSWSSDDDEEQPSASKASDKARASTPVDENPYKRFLS